MINRRKGVDGEEFGIGFAVALPEGEAWNGDFMMQGGGGGNGDRVLPCGSIVTPATSQPWRADFAVASTDTGHKAKTGPFDFSFMRDQQAYLDFAYLANAEVAGVAKKIIAQYFAKPRRVFLLRGLFDRRTRRHDSVAALSHGLQWHRLRRSGDAHRPVESGHRQMDSGGVQPGCSRRMRQESRSWISFSATANARFL